MPDHDDIAVEIRATVWRTYFLQAVVCVVGTVMAWNAIRCGLIGHHGHATLYSIGMLANYLAFEIAARTRALALIALCARKTKSSIIAAS